VVTVLTRPVAETAPSTAGAEPARYGLRPYQREAAQAVIAAYQAGRRRVLVQMATGLGKTILLSHLARAMVRRGGRVLIIAHREELIEQARSKLLAVDPSLDVGIVKAKRDDHDHAIVVASIQTIARIGRLRRLGSFAFIIVDEAHHAVARTYRGVLQYLGIYEDAPPPDDVYLLGVTATPGRGDRIGLETVFQQIVYRMGILEGIQGGYLCDVRAKAVMLATTFDDVRSQHGDLVEGELGRALLAADAPEHVVQAYLEHAAGRRAIVFTPTVAVAEAMAETFRAAGIPAAMVCGSTPADERAEILAGLAAGTIRVVANCAVLTEGFDCPPVDCIVIARPTKSSLLYSQMLGRGTRTHEGKVDLLVLDVTGQAGRHDLVTAASLFGVSAKLLDTVRLTQAVEIRDEQARARVAEREERERAEAERQQLIAREIDLWRQQHPERVHWRDQPATGKQLGWLRWQGIPYGPGLTKGEAHDLISAAKSRAS
jgi:superfamily II DNA or RNA helicase